MLRHIDVFIGVAIVMLAVSMLLTIVTQMISFVANFRGKQLQKGLAELFKELGIAGDTSELARKILLHPLIADGLGTKRVAPAIHKCDLKVLIAQADTLLTHAVKISNVDVSALKSVADQVETWFDATMSRVSNRFAMQTRLVTIGCALVAAFALQLDAFGLVTRLYADSDLRTKLAGAAEGMLTESERIMLAPTAFQDAAATLARDPTGTLGAPPANIASREHAVAWIRGAVNEPDKAKKLLEQYDKLLEESLTPGLKKATGELSAINATLASAGFELIPTPYRPFHYESFLVLLGVLTSAGLLSLGAPFWFNTLKTVTNLRPAIATAVESRDDATKK